MQSFNSILGLLLLLSSTQSDSNSFSWKRIGHGFARAVEEVGLENIYRSIAVRVGESLEPQVDSSRRRGSSNGDSDKVERMSASRRGNKRCSAIIEPSLELDCHLEGVTVNCSRSMPVGTEVHMRCQEAYEFSEYPGYSSVTCTPSNEWSEAIVKCVPDCGKRVITGAAELVSNGERASVSEFPWHVGVYKPSSSRRYAQICGGTLITPALVISAAHCFWDNNRNRALDTTYYKLAAGKYHRDWSIEDEETQKRDLDQLYIHDRYNGLKRNLAYDIAMIKVDKEFKLTWAINIICMDYPSAFEHLQLVHKNRGIVVGWGITENNMQSDVLMSVELPYVDFHECADVVEVPFQKFLTDDKICGGFIGRSTSVCPGDSGGGYVFPQATKLGIRYFLRGVVSAGHKPYEQGRKCGSQQLSAFTLVSKHRAFVERHVFKKRHRQ